MEFNFKKFEGRNRKQEDRITITRKSYSMGFPQKFYIDNKINEYKYVVLYWDSNNKAIAIHFSNSGQETNKIKISVSKDGYGGGVGIKNFLRFYKIDPEIYYGRYDWKKEDLENIGKVYIIELKEHIKKDVSV